jgi:hypothetical protein
MVKPMSVSKRLLEAIDKSENSDEIKELLKTLLFIELRNSERGDLHYSEEYDRVIKRIFGVSLQPEASE